MTVKPWETLSSEVIGDHRIFKLRRQRSRSLLSGREGAFVVLETPDWVNVIPVTADGRVVMIRQYRHGTNDITLEIPGGMCDPGDTKPADAGRRELREETGYDSDPLVELGVCAPNPATQDNRIYTYLAPNARPAGDQQLDGNEEIDVELVALHDVPALIASGAITHALVIAAFYFLDHRDAAAAKP